MIPEPLILSQLILSIGESVVRIYKIAKSIKDAKNDVKILCDELFALKGVLEHVQTQVQACAGSEKSDEDPDELPQLFKTQEFSDMLSATQGFLVQLLKDLERPKRHLKAALQSLGWPFTKLEVQEHVARLERVKSWFMFAMIADGVDLSRDTYQEVCKLSKDLRDERENREQEKEVKRKHAILEKLSPVNPEQNHLKACRMRQIGTGQWFLNQPFKAWYENCVGSILWLSGKSGAGKTVLLSSAVEEAKVSCSQQSNAATAYFYCAFNDTLSQEPANILGSIAAQLSESKSDLISLLTSAFQEEGVAARRDHAKLDKLEEHLRLCFESLSKVYIFVDAVNESSQSTAICSILTRLFQSTENVYIFLTGIEEAMPKEIQETSRFTSLRLDSRDIKKDVGLFVEARLRENPTLRDLKDRLKEEIRTTLVGKAHGMFRWVQCQIDYLSLQRTPNAVRKALRELPETIDETYSAMLQRIPGPDKDLAREALFWLSFALKPLSLQELCEAVVLEDDGTDLDEDSRLQHPRVLLEICHGLITFNPELGRVALAHFSVKTYLVSDRMKAGPSAFYRLDPTLSNARLAEKCLTYLSLPAFASGYCDHKTLWRRLKDWPLLDYAAHIWGLHVRAIGQDITHSLQTRIREFFATSKLPGGGNFGAWVQVLLRSAPSETVEMTQPLYYAASFGLTSVVRTLIETDKDLNLESCGGRHGSSALHVAAYRGHYDVVELLLRAGADPRAENDLGETALLWARTKGFGEICELLIRYGATE